MADLQQCADDSIAFNMKWLNAIDAMVANVDIIDKDKVRAIEAGQKISATVIDRVYPKKSASRNENVEYDFAKILAANLPKRLLLQIEEHMALEEPKYVESEVGPSPQESDSPSS